MFSDVSGKFYSASIDDAKTFVDIDLGNWMIAKPVFHNSLIYTFTLNGDIITIQPENFEIVETINTDKIVVGDPKVLEIDGDEYILLPTEKEGIETVSYTHLTLPTTPYV